MILVVPHTDLEGSYAIGECIRSAIAGLHIPCLDQMGVLRVTVSRGVVASSDGDKDSLITDADAALYTANRDGRNRTVQSAPHIANVLGGE